MAEQKIELRKIRDFSENLNDTFVFIKQNFKPLLISFITIAGVFLLANSIVSGIYQSQFGSVFKDLLAGSTRIARSPFEFINGTYFLIPLLTWFSMTAMHVVIAGYMKLYDVNQKGAPATQEVWEVFKKYYFKVLFYTVPIYLLTIIGFLFCIAPGVYFWVVFTPFPIILVAEDATFSGAYNRCFTIIKENFWQSFVIYFVVYIIYAFSSGIISGMLALITGVLSYFTTRDITTTIGLATSVLNVFTFVFYIVFYVSAVLHYFTLTEKYDGTGILKRLDKLGESGTDFNNIQEQY